MPGGGGGADLDVVTAGAGDVLAGKVIVGPDGEPLTGTMENQGAKTAALNCGGSYTIPAGYHNGAGKITANSLASQTPGNLAANKMLAGTYGYSNGARVDGNIASQGALTLNPGTTAKTGSVSGKYMTGNITVPAVSIPAAYIKKNQVITFPDGSKVTGTFEGWVATPTDLYYNGNNVAGFTGQQSTISFDEMKIVLASSQYGCTLISAKSYSFTPYSKLNIDIEFTGEATSSNTKIYLAGYTLDVDCEIQIGRVGAGRRTYSLDISNIDETFTPRIAFYQTSWPNANYVYHIWLS